MDATSGHLFLLLNLKFNLEKNNSIKFGVPPGCILNGGTVPPGCILTGGTVPPGCILNGGTVPPGCILNGGTVPPFNLFHKGKTLILPLPRFSLLAFYSRVLRDFWYESLLWTAKVRPDLPDYDILD